jgi:hypothetical protein
MSKPIYNKTDVTSLICIAAFPTVTEFKHTTQLYESTLLSTLYTFVKDLLVYSTVKQDRQYTYNITQWRVRVIFKPPRQS